MHKPLNSAVGRLTRPGMRVLVAPLNWGLGHAVRSAVVVEALRDAGCEVFLCADGAAARWLAQEFPDLPLLHLPDIGVHLPARGGSWPVAWSLRHWPGMRRNEIKTIDKWHQRYNFDLLISDNRYGVFHPQVPSVLITHQLQPPWPWWGKPAQQLLNNWLRAFNEIWVPDLPGNPLCGKMGQVPSPLRHSPKTVVTPIGYLSSFPDMRNITPVENTVLYLLSGAEPARTLWERALLNEWGANATTDHRKIILIRGTQQALTGVLPRQLAEVHHLADRKTVEKAFRQAQHIVCRAGYTTLMDLKATGRPHTLVPTPGQREQHYLFSRHTTGLH